MKLARFQKFGKLTDIPHKIILDSGIKCLMIDMDSTLIAWHSEEIGLEHEKWCRDIMMRGVSIIIVSNAVKERTEKIARKLDVKYIATAMKPAPFSLWKAAGMAGVSRNECVMIGDQILTDKLAARLAGVKFILLNPLSNVEFGMTKLNRKIEKLLFGRDCNK